MRRSWKQRVNDRLKADRAQRLPYVIRPAKQSVVDYCETCREPIYLREGCAMPVNHYCKRTA